MRLIKPAGKFWTTFLLVSSLFLAATAPARGLQGNDHNVLRELGDGRELIKNPSAPYLTEYFGADCQGCKNYAKNVFPRILAELVQGGQINYRLKHRPGSNDSEVLAVHNSLECAADQNRFWAAKMMTAGSPATLTEIPPEEAAEILEIPGPEKFVNCVKEKKHLQEIRRQRNQARQAGISGMPAFELLGERWYGVRDPNSQAAKIKRILDQAETTPRTNSGSKFQIKNVSFNPASPAELGVGERLEFSFDYHNPYDTKVWIWGRPTTDGTRTSSSIAHASPLYSTGQGSGQGHFHFNRETDVDGVKFMVRRAGTEKNDFEETAPVDYRWTEHPMNHDSGTAEARFLTGQKLFKQLSADVKAADSSIRAYKIVYPFNPDSADTSPAKRLARLLIDRAESGVDVQILTSSSNASIIRELTENAEQYYENTPVEFSLKPTLDELEVDGESISFRRSSSVIYGQAVLIDGEVLYLGNFVFSNNDLGGPNSPGLRLEGPGIQDTTEKLSKLFNAHFGKPGPAWKNPDPVKVEDFQLHFSEDITAKIIEIIESAEERIDIGQYRLHAAERRRYKPILEALVEAHRSGVQVNVALQQPDRRAESSDVKYLTERGVPVHLYDHPDTQYHRFMVVDRERVYLGSQKFNTELSGRGYGLSFTGRSPELGRQISSYLDYWLEHTKTIEARTDGARTTETEPSTKSGGGQLSLKNLRSGNLNVSKTLKQKDNLGRLSLEAGEIRGLEKNFSRETGASINGRSLAFEINGISRQPSYNRVSFEIRTPEYPTLSFERLVPTSPLLKINWKKVTTGEDNENIAREDAWQPAEPTASFFSPGRFSHGLSLTSLGDTLTGLGSYHTLIPSGLAGTFLELDKDLPWSPGDSNLRLEKTGQKQFNLTPYQGDRLLGLVGFDKTGERIYGSARLDYTGDSPGLSIRFAEPPEYLLALKLRGFRKKSVSFRLKAGLKSGTVDAREGTEFKLGDQEFVVAEVNRSTNADTSHGFVGTRSAGKNIQGLVGFDESGQRLRSSRARWGRGGSRGDWKFSYEKTWRGQVQKIEALQANTLEVKSSDHEPEMNLFEVMSRRVKTGDKSVDVEDYEIDTGPNEVSLRVHYDSGQLEAPELLTLTPRTGSDDQPRLGILGNLTKIIDPNRSTVVFSFFGRKTSNWEKPHVTGLNIRSHEGDGLATVFRHENFSHSFQKLDLAGEAGTKKSGPNEVEVTDFIADTFSPTVEAEYNYRSDHGQNVLAVVQLGTRAQLDAKTTAPYFAGYRLLTSRGGRFRQELGPGLTRLWQSPEKAAEVHAELTHVSIAFYSLDQIDPEEVSPSKQPEPFHESILRLEDI